MSDDSSTGGGWHPPADPTGAQQGIPAAAYGPAGGAFAPPEAAYGPPPSSAQGQPQPGPSQPTNGWVPAPKPGLIPLHPLTLGNILSASFGAFRRNPRPTLGFALLSQFLVGVLTTVLIGLVTWFQVARFATANNADADAIGAGVIVSVVLSYLVSAVLLTTVVALLQGIVVIEVARATLGEKLTMRQLLSRARGRMMSLVGWMLLLVAAFIVIFALIGGVIALFSLTLGGAGIAIGVIVGIFGSLAVYVLSAWVGTKLSVVPSVLMLERQKLFPAIRRSWRLTDRNFWRLFGIQLLVSFILSFAVQIVVTPLSFFLPFLVLLIDPNGQNQVLTVVIMLVVMLLFLALIFVVTSIMLIIQSTTTGLLYIDLRMRKEGLDLELARFVEERSSGNPTVDDPYLLRPNEARGAWNTAPAAPSWQPGTAHPPAAPIPPTNESPWS